MTRTKARSRCHDRKRQNRRNRTRMKLLPRSIYLSRVIRVDLYRKGEMVVKQHIKNVVLVHGAFADGSGWKRVADILKNDGYKGSVVQHPETSYADDQKYTKA